MMHKIQFLVNGIWLEHNAKDSLFPIVSTRNSTENELKVLYLDCSLADINLQFLDLFEFTSSFVFWFYVAEGIGLAILFVLFMSKEDLDAKDAGTDNDDIDWLCFAVSWIFTLGFHTVFLVAICRHLFQLFHQCDFDFDAFVHVSCSSGTI
jgi:hypothetical protein